MHPKSQPITIIPDNAQSYLSKVKDTSPTLWVNEAKACIQIATPKTITNPTHIITHLPFGSTLSLNNQEATQIFFQDIPRASVKILNHLYPLNEFIANFSNLENKKSAFISGVLAGLPFKTSDHKGNYYGPFVAVKFNDVPQLSKVGPSTQRNALVCLIFIYISLYIYFIHTSV